MTFCQEEVKTRLKPISATTNVVGLQTDDAGHVGQNSSTHVARVIGLQTDVTKNRFKLTYLHQLDFIDFRISATL